MATIFGAMTGAVLHPGTSGLRVTHSSTWLHDSQEHAETLAKACRDYATDHQGQYPATLEELYPAYLPDKTKLEDPLEQSPGTTGFTYHMAGRTNPGEEEVLLVSRGKTNAGKKVVAYVKGTTALEENP